MEIRLLIVVELIKGIMVTGSEKTRNEIATVTISI